MNKTEKVALRESMIIVLMGAVINFPLQTYLLWLTMMYRIQSQKLLAEQQK